MWPFLSKIPNIERISEDADEITIIHDKGAFKVQKSEILDFKLESDHFSGRLIHLPFFFSFRGIILSYIFFGGIMNVMIDLVYDSKNEALFHFYFSIYAWCTSILSGVILYFISTYFIKLFDLRTGLNYYKKDILVFKLNQSTIKLRDKYFYFKKYQFFKNSQTDEPISYPIIFDIIKSKFTFWAYIIVTLLIVYYFVQNKVPTFHYLILKAIFVGSGDYSEIQTYFDIYHGKHLWLYMHGGLSAFITPLIIVTTIYATIIMFMLTISYVFWPAILFFSDLNYKRINENLWKTQLIWGIIFGAALFFNHYVYQNIIFTIVTALVTIIILFISASREIRNRFNLAYDWHSYKSGIWVCLLFYSLMHFVTLLELLIVNKVNIETRRLIAIPELFLAIVALIIFFVKWTSGLSFDDWDQKKNNKKFWNKLLMPYPSVVISWVSKDGLILEKLPQQYKENYEIVSAAMDQNITAFEFAPEEMKKDHDFIQEKITYYEKCNRWNSDDEYLYHIEYLRQFLF
jgi:hypothetical protein